ncbi:MAG: hypothetical protein ACK47B_20860 [Armatimonadota bacterium]
MQYLTVEESVRRLRAAGVPVRTQTVLEWIEKKQVRDVWVVGRHTFIYEGELDRMIHHRH